MQSDFHIGIFWDELFNVITSNNHIRYLRI